MASVLLTFRELEESIVAPVMDGMVGVLSWCAPSLYLCVGGSRELSLLGGIRGHLSEQRKETQGEEI